MSPWPSSCSAPLWSRIVRESTLRGHLERDARRDVRLDQAGDDVDRRPLRREDHVHAGGARLLREARDQLLDLLADAHHQVGELVDDDDDERQRLGSGASASPRRLGTALGVSNGSRIGLPASIASLTLRLKPREVAHAERAPRAGSGAPSRRRPPQRVGRLLHVGDDRREHVRNAVVDRELEHLGVDHDQPDVARPCLVEQRSASSR